MKQPASSRPLPKIVTAVALATAGDGTALPTRMRILAWGDNPNSQGKRVVVGPPLVEALRAPTYPYRQIALDYEHNTWPGSAAYKETREPREVAAFLSVEVIEGQGVFVNVDRWTASGLKNASNYCDLSATPQLDKDGNVVAIVAVALTRTGAVPDITFAQAAMSAAPDTTASNPGNIMNWKELIAKELGLAPDCTDEELQAAWQKHLKAVQAATAAAADGTAAALSAETIGGIVATAIKTHTAALTARLDGQEKRKIVADAQGDGKVVCLSDALLAKLSVEDLRAHVAALPVAVPLTALTPVAVAEGRTVTLSATELAVCKALGLTAEAYAKEKEVAQ